MSSSRLLTVAVTGWPLVVLALLVLRVSLQVAPIAVAEAGGWLALACVPPAIMLFAFHQTASTISLVLGAGGSGDAAVAHPAKGHRATRR